MWQLAVIGRVIAFEQMKKPLQEHVTDTDVRSVVNMPEIQIHASLLSLR